MSATSSKILWNKLDRMDYVVLYTGNNSVLQHRNAQKLEYGEYRGPVHILCGVHKNLYKIPQKTSTELPYFLDYRRSGQIVDQKCFVLFLCFFFSVCIRKSFGVSLRYSMKYVPRTQIIFRFCRSVFNSRGTRRGPFSLSVRFPSLAVTFILVVLAEVVAVMRANHSALGLLSGAAFVSNSVYMAQCGVG